MASPKQSSLDHQRLLGQIIATVLAAAIDAGAIAVNPQGVASNPAEVLAIIEGFVGIWAPQAMPKQPTTVTPALGQSSTIAKL